MRTLSRQHTMSLRLSPAAMNICGRHRRIMESYIQALHVHATVVRTPSMLGGPFIDYNGERVDEIRGLLERTEREQVLLIALNDAIRELDELLAREAAGHSLEPLYPRVLDLLRGYV